VRGGCVTLALQQIEGQPLLMCAATGARSPARVERHSRKAQQRHVLWSHQTQSFMPPRMAKRISFRQSAIDDKMHEPATGQPYLGALDRSSSHCVPESSSSAPIFVRQGRKQTAAVVKLLSSCAKVRGTSRRATRDKLASAAAAKRNIHLRSLPYGRPARVLVPQNAKRFSP